MRSFLVVLAGGLILALSTPGYAQLGRGIGSGRASESDVAALGRDIGRVSVAERGLNEVQRDVETTLLIDRQRSLFEEFNSNLGDLGTQTRNWWVEHVLQPALDIAANPAASCSLARTMLGRALGLEAQAQLIGLGDAPFGDLGDNHTILGQVAEAVAKRCLSEAFDECMETGNGRVFLDLARSLTFVPGVAWNEEQAAYLFRRCTVYELEYSLELRNEFSADEHSATLDGSYTLLYSGTGGDLLTRLGSGEWRREGSGQWADELDMGQSNVVLRLQCSAQGFTVTCTLDGSPRDQLAEGVIGMRRVAQEMRIRVVNETPADAAAGGRVVFETTHEETGEDVVRIEFEPPSFESEAFYHSRNAEYETGGPTSEIFYRATGANAFEPYEIAPWTRVGYPVLYEAAINRNNRPPGDRILDFSEVRGTFELQHRPDLFPSSEIDPGLELPIGEPGRPPRIPLQ